MLNLIQNPKTTIGFTLLVSVSMLTSCATPQKATAPSVLARAEWGANPPVAEMKRHRPDHITVHHTATRQNRERPLADKLRALQKFSQNEGKLASGKTKPAWPDVPYHYYIDVSGEIGEGREVHFVGDTNTEYDPTGHALIVLEGSFGEEQMSDAQLESLRQLTLWLANKYNVPASHIAGHKDFAQTACPGKRLHEYLPQLREFVASSR